ncbi:MAG: exodeoxyribonuclease III [Bacteroidales bacterium]|nr:exodeoxyribonuclease III [Bacteroidales bacterium]
MKIISYNLNGIRAAVTKGLYNWLKEENPDILCIQETKAQPEQIDEIEFKRLGYKCYWFSAQKKGYSGTGIVTKIEPKHVEYGMGIEEYDDEGRVIRADFDDFSVISVYHPSGTSGDERQAFKMQWLEDFTDYIETLRKDFPKLIINGDFNICRLWIDINNPEKHEDVSGFLPEEREWFQRFVDLGYVDSFREFNSEAKQYSWWSYRGGSYQKNLGWRIDYNMVTYNLKDQLRSAFIRPELRFSDHCPVGIEIFD